MFNWIRGIGKKQTSSRKVRSRDESAGAEKVEVAAFAPEVLEFLGLTAYLQLEMYEAATRGVSGAPTLQAKEVLAGVAGATLQKHQRFAEEIRRRGRSPHVVMQPYSTMIEDYITRIDAVDWHQHILSIYLVGGLFDDFFAELASGIKDPFSREAIATLSDHAGRDELKRLLQAELEADPKLGSWLAVWGRRLVGDTLLMARAVLSRSANREFDADAVEPVFTELIADHIRRMDGLGRCESGEFHQ